MKCPHCQIGIFYEPLNPAVHRLGNDNETGVELSHGLCPECNQLIIILKHGAFRWIDDAGELVDVACEKSCPLSTLSE